MISAALVAIPALTLYLRLLYFGQYIDADVGNLGYLAWRMAEGEVLLDLKVQGSLHFISCCTRYLFASLAPLS